MCSPHSRLLRRIAARTALSLVVPFAAVQSQASAPGATNTGATPSGGSAFVAAVRGTVFDSLSGAPLTDAVVQLVAADANGTFGKTVNADGQGRFVFDSVPDGRYALGFFHPMLDSLGIEPPLRAVQVRGQQSITVGTGVPAPSTFRASVCGQAGSSASDAVLVGFVRDARTRESLAGAAITVSWREMTISTSGTRTQMVHRQTVARENGWYALCQVPSPGTIHVMAHRGADSTDTIELEVPASGFLRRELSVGSARPVARAPRAGTADAADSATRALLPIRSGDGTLRGRVITAGEGGIGSRPLADAQVGLVNGPQAVTNALGEWTLTNVPLGTRTLEVRAVGYYPGRRAVDVVTDAPPQTIALSTFKSVLDTMRVRARTGAFATSGFLERSRSGNGSFITPNDLAVRNAFVTTDIFRHISGVFIEPPSAGDMDGGVIPMGLMEGFPAVLMRSAAGLRCAPAVVLNGTTLMGLNATDLNNMLVPSEIRGIEVYRPGQSPAQFTPNDGTLCGSIVIWSDQARPSRR